jgi:hypothetical protein
MVILLDIDGVMVPAKSWKTPEFLADGFSAFSNKSVGTLQRLISEDTTVVLTTSHKANFTIEEWKKIFKNRGINIKNLRSLPFNSNNLSRKDEIINWFNNNSVDENFIIIDDDKSLNELPDSLKENWVQTSPYIGLTEEHIEVVKSLLHRGIKPLS